MATLRINIELTIGDEDDPEDVLEDVKEQLGWVVLENPAWQPTSVQILDEHECNEGRQP
jgi:hypothetical protein